MYNLDILTIYAKQKGGECMKNEMVNNKGNSILFRNKVITYMAICFTMLFVIGMTSLTVNAESVREIEPNDTMETAQTITANNETAQGAVSGSYAGQYVVKGYTSKTDSDWFKVYLNVGTKYLTCNGNEFDYLITNADRNVILEGTYLKSGFGPTAYRFNVTSSGYYYIKITGIVPTLKSYLFLVGSPTYSVSNCEIPCREGTIVMTSGGGNQVGHFDGSFVSDLPEDAIAYTVDISGLRSTSVNSIRLKNEDKGVSFNLTRYSWYKDGLTLMELPVSSTWTASFEYNKATSFTPVLNVYYVYPVYTTMVE